MDPSLTPYHYHHLELLRLAQEHESRLVPMAVRNHPDACLDGARRLVARAKAHVAMENTVLYPALLGTADTAIQAAARATEADLGNLKSLLGQFGHHWKSAETIRLAPEAFIQASKDLIRVLRRRISEEETQLFPLVERS